MSDTDVRMERFLVESSAQIRSPLNTAKIMWAVVLALVPAGIWGVVVFGVRSLIVVALSIIMSVLTEWGLNRLSHKRQTIQDGSAFLTGLLIGYNMPPSVPIFIPVIASIFAIAVVKFSFGGLGGNWMNPALAGRVFVFFSWTGGMSAWRSPSALRAMDTLSGATPLATLKTGLLDHTGGFLSSTDFLGELGYPVSRFASSVSGFFADTLGMSVSPINIDLFIGNVSGCIGEVSALLLIAGFMYLMVKKIVIPIIPFVYILSFSLLVWVFGGLRAGGEFFTGDVWFNLMSGGLMLGALYMATDMVTSPLTAKGMAIFGLGVGFLTFLFRFYGSLPEGVSLAIIIMNIFVPMIDRYVVPRKFGKLPKEGKKA